MTSPQPDPVPVDMAVLCDHIGWDVLLAVSDGRFMVLRHDGVPSGLRVTLHDGWEVSVVLTADGYAVGRGKSVFEARWVFAIPAAAVAEAFMRCAVTAAAWPPTVEDP